MSIELELPHVHDCVAAADLGVVSTAGEVARVRCTVAVKLVIIAAPALFLMILQTGGGGGL